jgi:hypothetical protein
VSKLLGLRDDLKKNWPESVQLLESLKFEWLQQVDWQGYRFIRKDGTVDKFSYQELSDHDTAWIKSQLAAAGFFS